MKVGREHRVPLSQQALDVLQLVTILHEGRFHIIHYWKSDSLSKVMCSAPAQDFG
jgi:hypothetical protein